MRNLELPGLEPARHVQPAPTVTADVETARSLPPGLRLGTSSWSFPGWAATVYRERYARGRLAREGLAAYAQHPLLGCVGLDRTYYAPMDVSALRALADAVPDGFRFVCKAHEHVTWMRFPDHPRHGARAGRRNSRFLDPHYARDAVVEPLVEGLADKLGCIVFQFPPRALESPVGSEAFADALARMLVALPRGPAYAVEIRTRALLTPAYAQALRDTGATHCLCVHPLAPPLADQARLCARLHPRPLVVRWNLGHGRRYEEARALYAPFDRLRAPDPHTRGAIAKACLHAVGSGAEALVAINNKAEGSAPLSVRALATEIVAPRPDEPGHCAQP